VLALAARRRELDPHRAPDDLDEITPRVVKVERVNGDGRLKYAVTAQVAGLGTIRGWYYFPREGPKAEFIAPPARKVGSEWIEFIDPLRTFNDRLMRAVREFLRESDADALGGKRA
jgi:hypothetical protein